MGGGELAGLGFVGLLTVVSLLAVWVPLYRGLKLCLRARAATRLVPAAALRRRLEQPVQGGVEPLALLMLRVLTKSLYDGDSDAYSSDFVLDASRQYVVNQYEANYSHLVSMYANLLPPIGFIGTTSGMGVLLLSIHLSDGALELGALAIALTSSIFALIGFALLEGVKIRLYLRLLVCLDEVVALHQSVEKDLLGAISAATVS